MQRILFLVIVIGLTLTAGINQTYSARYSTAETTSAQVGEFAVTIIVADFFEEVADETVDSEGLCAITPTEQGYAVRGFSVEPSETLTHGEIVVEVLEEALHSILGDDISAIEIVEVNLESRSDTEIVTAIDEAIEDAEDADFIVLNMSFAFVPCEFVEALEAFGGEFTAASEAKSLNQYRGVLNRAVAFYDNQVFPAMSNRFSDEDDLHPLQTVLDDHPNVIAVSAAGNFGLDYPFWPGAFHQVISVSASNDPANGQVLYANQGWVKQGNNKDRPLLSLEGTGNNQNRISNYGEVMIPGEFEVTSDEILIGTSFAAPRLSAVLALYLSHIGGDYCADDDGHIAIATGDYENLTLAEVEADVCTDLADYLPDF